MGIQLTERAADQIRSVIKDKGVSAETGLRVAIKGGGCSGFSYFLDLTDRPTEFDEQLESQGIPVFCDRKSLMFVDGTTIDFDRTRLGGGFTFENPKSSGSCGCGTSFQV